MIPHVIVLEPGLVVYKIYNGYWFFGRPTMEDLRQDLRAVTKKCRPDWDITTPELKAAWQQGRKDLFFPYGKTYVQTLGEQDRAGIKPNAGFADGHPAEFSPPRSAASPVSMLRGALETAPEEMGAAVGTATHVR